MSAAATDDTTLATYAVYDVETTTRSPVGFAASPFYPDNKLVLAGWKYNHGSVVQTELGYIFPKAKLYVGCNIKFDLLWAARESRTTPARLVGNARVWDVSLAEYVLSRQRERMPSLDRCAQLHGLTSHKRSGVGEAIKGGMCPSSIAMADLKEYNEDDLNLTEQVFLKQFEEANERGMLPLLWSQMQALVATCEMEHHGLLIDREVLDKLGEEYTKLAQDAHDNYIRALDECRLAHGIDVAAHWWNGEGYEESIGSNKCLSLLFFGGKVDHTVRELVGKYKNGKDKYKNKVVKLELGGLRLSPVAQGSTLTKNGYWTVDDAVLKSICAHYSGVVRDLADAVRKYREAHKQLSTYIDGVRQNIWPDGRVHCSFNHTVTLTGRLSCSAPNLQNQTDGPIKTAYVATPEYFYVEFDYSQLEVVGLAVLSGDPQLLADISDGVDIHATLFQELYGAPPTVSERKAFKPLTFGLIYGAEARTLAENSGRTVTEAKDFMRVFYNRYRRVKEYHEQILADAKLHRKASSRRTEKGYPAGVYIRSTPTGREYEFVEYDSLGSWSGGITSFSPTELKNWPIQGFSTGDVVPLMLGYVVSEVLKSKWAEHIRPVVTVHDSIMFEVRMGGTDEDECLNFLNELMSKTRQVILDRFGFDIGLELKTEYKCGMNWKEMK